MSVSRETEKLPQYVALIRKWNPAINLVAPSTLDRIEERHVHDCLQLVQLSGAVAGSWVDLGSGGGLPGLVVAISRPELRVMLVESDRRKAAFLRNAVRELRLGNVDIISDRIEKLQPLDITNVSARALAPLPLLLSYVARHMEPNGKAWLMKGRNWQGEVAAARDLWDFQMSAHPSLTDPNSVILEVSELRHAQ